METSMKDSPLQKDSTTQLLLVKKVKKSNSEEKINITSCLNNSGTIVTPTRSSLGRIVESTGCDHFRANFKRIINLPIDNHSSAISTGRSGIMNSQYYGTTNDNTNSNLHLLSKVIEDAENEIHRATTGTLTNPNPSHEKASSMSMKKVCSTLLSPDTEDDGSKKVIKSWKKKVIVAMDGKQDNVTDAPPTSPHTVSTSSNVVTSKQPFDEKSNDLRDHHDKEEDVDDDDDDDDDDNIDDSRKLSRFSDNNDCMESPLRPMNPLPHHFKPGPYDVLCGRGRTCKDAPGNKAYREIIMNHLQIYADANTKVEKGQIISNIMEQIKKQCCEYHGGKDNVGGFIKHINGRWYDVGEFLAREKTSQCFRDALSALYSSSAQSKYLRRRASKVQGGDGNCDNKTTDSSIDNKRLDMNQYMLQMFRNGSTGRHSGTFESSNMDTYEGLKRLENAVEHPTKKMRRVMQEESENDSSRQKLSMLRGNMLTTHHEHPTLLCASGVTHISQSSLVDQINQSGIKFIHAPTTSTRYANNFATPPITAVPRKDSGSQMAPFLDSFIDVCALQLELRAPDESPFEALTRCQRLMEKVTAANPVDIFVLPELAPIGYCEDTFAKFLPINASNQAMYQEFDRIFQVTARKLNTYICYGTIGWSYENRNVAMIALGVPRLFIRQVVVDRLGTQVACYDKTYLCNYGVCAESRYFQPGPASVPTSFQVYSRDHSYSYRFGLLICSDMRYSHLSSTLVADPEHRVDCILQPSAFARDSSFRTWKSFRETRAVENSTFWIGINYSGPNFGETTIVPPFIDDDHEPVSLPHDEGYVIGRIAQSTLDHARTVFPFYNNLLANSKTKVQR